MRFVEFLVEYNRHITQQKLGSQLLDAFKKEGQAYIQRYLGTINQLPDADSIINWLLEKLEQADPTKNKQYVQWIARVYTKGDYHLEDIASRIPSALEKYYKLNQKKQIPAPQNDINRFTSFVDFENFVDNLPEVEGNKQEDRGDAKQYYQDNYIRVIVPEDQTAACYYGRGTRWCTAAKQNNMFSSYHADGPLYIIIPSNPTYPGEKYQFHFEAKQFMDEKDHSVNLSELSDKYPSLKVAFKNQIEKYNVLPLKYSKSEIDLAIKTMAKTNFNKLKESFQQGIPKILTNYKTNLASIENPSYGLKTNKNFLYQLLEQNLIHESTKLFKEVWNVFQYSYSSIIDLIFEGGIQEVLVEAIADWVYNTDMYDEIIEKYDPNYSNASDEMMTLIVESVEPVLETSFTNWFLQEIDDAVKNNKTK